MLLEEFLEPLGVSQVELARRIRLPVQRVNEIVRGKRGVTPNTALRLGRALGTSAGFWLNLQLAWDLYQALHSREADVLEEIEPLIRSGA
jgi:antitoxin HigA-1